jgi:TolB-like protein/Tfp pilus assembly protein PilF
MLATLFAGRGCPVSLVVEARESSVSSRTDVPSRRRLDSWKAVASHFGRDVTTVRRWERREGLPIHRLFHEKLGSIYAFTDELDAWWTARTARDARPEDQVLARENDLDADPVEPVGSAPQDTTAPTASEEETRPRAVAGKRRIVGVAIVLASAALLLAVIRGPDALKAWRDARSRAVAAPARAATPGVAVLPLFNVAGGDGDSYFADGMTTAVTAELAAIKSLKVIAFTSAKRYRERGGRSLAAIGDELGVDWIVQGSVERTGERVRITIGLTRADEGRPVWSKPFERPIDGILDLQAEIARAVMAQILGPETAAGESMRRANQVDIRAYELYLRGEFHVEQLNPVSLERAVDYFTQAVGADPGFAVAWAGLAKANLLQEMWGNAGHRGRENEVRRATLKALALDPDLAEAHDVMGRAFLMYDLDWAAAEAAFRKAVAEAPSLAVAYNGYSLLLQTLVRYDEALTASAKARELDPMAAWSWTEEGRALYRARRHGDAEARYKRALAIDPGFAPAVDRLAQLYLVQRRLPEARSMIALLERLPSSRSARRLRAWLAAVEGDRATALEASAELNNRHVVLITLGDHDAAFVELDRAVVNGSLPGFGFGNPELDPVRRDPRFARIVARLGLPVDKLVALGR